VEEQEVVLAALLADVGVAGAGEVRGAFRPCLLLGCDGGDRGSQASARGGGSGGD
jgi:hypothetical protein